MAGSAAVIVVEPVAREVIFPRVPALLLIVATDVVDELQSNDSATSRVVPSEKSPVDVNCLESPRAMFGLVGVMVTAVSVADVTVNVVDPMRLVAASVAVMDVVPTVKEVANPKEPGALPMEATLADDELQFTEKVISCELSSEYVPIALNCLVNPMALLGEAGVTVMEVSNAAVTVTVVEPETGP